MSEHTRLVEQARAFTGKNDRHDVSCSRCIVAGLADAVEQLQTERDAPREIPMGVMTHYLDRPELLVEIDAARARVAELEAGIREHRDRTLHRDRNGAGIHFGTHAQAVNERLWSLLDSGEGDQT